MLVLAKIYRHNKISVAKYFGTTLSTLSLLMAVLSIETQSLTHTHTHTHIHTLSHTHTHARARARAQDRDMTVIADASTKRSFPVGLYVRKPLP